MKSLLAILAVFMGFSNAQASIIGLLHAWPGNNITIRYVLEGQTPILEIAQENASKCPVQLYRHDREDTFQKTVANAIQDESGTPVVGFGLWLNRPCMDALNEEDEVGPRVDRIDLFKEVFASPSFAKFRNDFVAGLFKMRFGLQLPAGHESQQAESKDLSYKLASGTVLYQTTYQKPVFRLFDLKLTAPKPVKTSLELNALTPDFKHNPKLPGALYKSPKVMLTVAPLKLNLSLAASKNTDYPEDVGSVYHHFNFHEGQIISQEAEYQLQREGKSYCTVSVHVPAKFKQLKEVNLPAQYYPNVTSGSYGGGGLTPEKKKELGLTIPYSWASPTFRGYGPDSSFSKSEIRMINLSCTTPMLHPNRNEAVELATAYRHLSLDGKPFIQFLTDYPGHQQDGPSNYAPVEIDASKIPSGLSSERKEMKLETPVVGVRKNSEFNDVWRPKNPSFSVILNDAVLPREKAIYTDLRENYGKGGIDNIYYTFAFKNRQVLSEAEMEREAKSGEFCVMSVINMTNELDDIVAPTVQIPSQRLLFDARVAEGVSYGRGREWTTDFGKRITDPKSLKMPGVAINLKELAKPEKRPYLEFSEISCFNSKKGVVIRLRDLAKHIGVNGQPMIRTFLTNEISLQK